MKIKTELMTPEEVGDALRVHSRQVTRWAKAGKLQHVLTVGKQRRYFRAEVDAYLAGQPLTPEQAIALRERYVRPS